MGNLRGKILLSQHYCSTIYKAIQAPTWLQRGWKEKQKSAGAVQTNEQTSTMSLLRIRTKRRTGGCCYLHSKCLQSPGWNKEGPEFGTGLCQLNYPRRSATDWKNKANESQVRDKVLNVCSFFSSHLFTSCAESTVGIVPKWLSHLCFITYKHTHVIRFFSPLLFTFPRPEINLRAGTYLFYQRSEVIKY